MLIAVLSGFALAAAAPWVHRATRNAGWVLGLLPLGLCIYFISLVPGVAGGETLSSRYEWIPSLGISLSFYVDGLGLTFAILISGIGFLVTVYSGGYLSGHEQLGRWYAFLMMFMASMLGVVLADNLIAMFVFWELTSLSSYFLIGFHHEEEESRYAALQALLVTGVGGLGMLAGLVLLGSVCGTFEVSQLLGSGDLVRSNGLYTPILLLVLFGAFTKSAQFPFHVWLPNAMAAPTPASAYLHSSTMVKAGVYLLARLSPVLGGTDSWHSLVTAFGAITMILGAYLAVRQNVLKRLLAYSTVSALGAMTMLLGVGTEYAVVAALAFLVAHALYKAALFLVSGAIDHETGERDVTKLGGLARVMPLTFAGAGLAALSMSGVPLTFGFIAKEALYEATLHEHGHASIVLTALAMVASMLFIVVAGCVAYRPFLGRSRETPKHPHEAPLSMWLGPVVLGCCSAAFGLAPHLFGKLLVAPAVMAVVGKHALVELSLWHGFNRVLALSGFTLLGGVALYLFRSVFCRITDPLDSIGALGPARWYDWGLAGLKGGAQWQTRVLQNGYLRVYLLVIILTVVALAGYVLVFEVGGLGGVIAHQVTHARENLRFYELGLALIVVVAIGAAVHSRTRLAAVAALGVVGYGVALIFVLFGAPDLAMTQFVIETFTVILFVLVFYHLPPFATYTGRATRLRDLAVAVTAGSLMGMLVLVAAESQAYPSISDFFAEHSYDMAHGRNIVNAILVDFRAIDTMGEITVLAVAGVGACALLKLRMARSSPPSNNGENAGGSEA